MSSPRLARVSAIPGRSVPGRPGPSRPAGGPVRLLIAAITATPGLCLSHGWRVAIPGGPPAWAGHGRLPGWRAGPSVRSVGPAFARDTFLKTGQECKKSGPWERAVHPKKAPLPGGVSRTFSGGKNTHPPPSNITPGAGCTLTEQVSQSLGRPAEPSSRHRLAQLCRRVAPGRSLPVAAAAVTVGLRSAQAALSPLGKVTNPLMKWSLLNSK
jgi:hypothetical protein